MFSLLEAHKTNRVFKCISSEFGSYSGIGKNIVGLLHSGSAEKSNETIKSAVLFQNNTNYLSSVVFQYITDFL